MSVSVCFGEGDGTPLQYSCLANPMDGGAWWAAGHGVTKSQTWLNNFSFTFHFHALEKEMATHSSVLAWRIPGTGEPGGLPCMGSHRVGHDWSDLAAAATCQPSSDEIHTELCTNTVIIALTLWKLKVYRLTGCELRCLGWHNFTISLSAYNDNHWRQTQLPLDLTFP